MIPPDPKAKERRASDSQVGTRPGICAFLIKEQKELKRKQQEKQMHEACERRIEKANRKWKTQSLDKNSKINRGGKTGYRKLQEVNSTTDNAKSPILRRVKKVEDLRDGTIQADTRVKAQRDANVYQMQMQRQLIREGNLERVVPSARPSQRPEFSLTRQNASVDKPKHVKSESTSSKLSSYMETTADILDATRRDLAANLRKSAEKAEKAISSKFDQLGRYSSGHGNDWGDDSDSDESFYCIGERRLSELDKARRISGPSTDPWIDGPQKECRLCRKPSPAGVRGLCRKCESDFRRPTAVFLYDEEDEVKPPAPLKIRKAKTASAHAQVAVGRVHSVSSGEANLIPKIDQVDKKPQVITQSKHTSQQTYVDDVRHVPQQGRESASKYEQWQSPGLRSQCRSRDRESTRWSLRLLDDKVIPPSRPSLRGKFNKARVSSVVDEDTTPLVVKDDKQSTRARSTKSTDEKECYDCCWDEA